jgi:tungstate transport system substrate-binding protein
MREGTINPKQIKFVSRGDDSGTHAKEKAIWKAGGYEYETVQNAGTWYIEAGTGMGSTLMMASEKEAYTLTDLGTYLAYQGRLELVPLVNRGSLLRNVYSAIAVNPENAPETKIDLANNLIGFLTSPEIQEIIGNYGVEEYERPLFTPGAGAEPK